MDCFQFYKVYGDNRAGRHFRAFRQILRIRNGAAAGSRRAGDAQVQTATRAFTWLSERPVSEGTVTVSDVLASSR